MDNKNRYTMLTKNIIKIKSKKNRFYSPKVFSCAKANYFLYKL